MIEREKRRESFDGTSSVPIRLCDGQDWLIPAPMVTMNPKFSDGVCVGHFRTLSYGPVIDCLMEAMDRVTDPGIRLIVMVAIGGLLLRINYDLDDAELARVLYVERDNPDSERILREIIAVATRNAI